jgi:hypothetical protein
VEIGGSDDCRWPRIVPVAETGDVLPDLSGEPSERIFDVASNSPIAFALDEPIAGAAFVSVLPTCRRCNWRGAAGLVAEKTDSVGLPGRSNTGGRSAELTPLVGRGESCADRMLDGGRGAGDGSTDVPDPLNADRRLRRSSNGAPVDP